MNVKEYMRQHLLVMDGGMGTLLQKQGLQPGVLPETWNITNPDGIENIHRAYYAAGSHVVSTNTFGANCLKFREDELEQIIRAGVQLAKNAREKEENGAPRFIALDMGPTGKMLKPFGDMDFEDAVEVFAKTVRIGAACGVDLILIETMNDSLETKAAVLAAKENCDLPVFVSNVYGADGKLMTGASPAAMVAMLEGLGVDALGCNCSLGPRQLTGVVEELLKNASIPVLVQPNAGLPRVENGQTVFDVTMEEFARDVRLLTEKGVGIVGGCCGTTPDYIRLLKKETKDVPFLSPVKKNKTVISSYSHAVEFGREPVLIGERINPTGKKRFQQALRGKDIAYVLNEGVQQQEKGVHVLDVNVGLPDIDEKEMLRTAVQELQAVLDLPLQIDSANAEAMEAALRCYNGKAMINSVNGKESSMEAVFPLVKKYGGVVVALTLDENGIPADAEGRVQIAKKILDTAEKYGIEKKDLIFDTLAMTVSSDHKAGRTTLQALKEIREGLHCHTSLGVSNVSFGLPCRDALNGVFFALALENGLSAAIMNPHSGEMMKTYHTYLALKGLDENCAGYIKAAENFGTLTAGAPVVRQEEAKGSDLHRAIVKGMQEQAAQCTRQMLQAKPGLQIVNEEIIPALNQVGEGFEKKTVYLPQLLMSAEAAKAAFEVIKETLPGGNTAEKGPVVLATVEGDIHDIGKNIVKLLLENYGYRVMDLGKDVKPDDVLAAVLAEQVPLAGLSALMTTTVPAMEKTIRLLRQNAPFCKVMVGGAVLTKEYADQIGADFYCRDAMEGVRCAESVCQL
ncbi:MAG: homocysteine S-methyltransferase family protein [Clostridia bacterium]|nr:homocysteine S-methyltransferase family protein [Clostridia bacterium]